MATIPDREIEHSALEATIIRVGFTVRVYIYRFAGTSERWTLEVVDHEGGSTVWDETFEDDLEAYEAFERAAAEDGMRSFSSTEGTMH